MWNEIPRVLIIDKGLYKLGFNSAMVTISAFIFHEKYFSWRDVSEVKYSNYSLEAPSSVPSTHVE